MKKIITKCTPQFIIGFDLDPNPNGYPVLWISFQEAQGNRAIQAYPLDKEALEELITECSFRLKEM